MATDEGLSGVLGRSTAAPSETAPRRPGQPAGAATGLAPTSGRGDDGGRWWPTWRQVSPLLVRLHFHAGVLVAPFVLVAAVTGLAYTTTPAIEHVVYARELRVHPGAVRLPLSEQVADARAAHPEGAISQVRPAPAPDATTRVVLTVPGMDPADTRTVFVDPYTGQVRGALTTMGEWLPVRTWVDTLHRDLHLGEAGRWYSELGASWLWVLALGGAALWVGRKRRERPGRRARTALVPARARPGRQRVLSWHGSLGLWTLVGLLFLSATGMTWSEHAGANISTLRSHLSWQTPVVDAGSDPSGSASAGAAASTTAGPAGDAAVRSGAGIDEVVAAARSAGLREPLELVPPARAGEQWQVDEVKRTWPVRQDSAAVSATTGEVTQVVRFATWPLAAKLAEWGIDAHMGLLFGVPGLLGLAALACGIITVVVWGYLMWWKRRPTTGSRLRMGARPRRAPLLALPWPFVAVTAVVAIVLGVEIPLFGLPLLGLLLLDVLLAALGQRPARDDVRARRRAGELPHR